MPCLCRPSRRDGTNPIILPFEGDKALIEKGATLSTVMTAVTMDNNNQITQNNGTITTTGDSAQGIFNDFGNNAVITNNGKILTQGIESFGISNGGDNASITNSGSISTKGTFSSGISNSGNNTVIRNSQNISILGSNADGIINNGINVHIINSGTIRAAQGFAIQSVGNNPILTLLRGSNLQGLVQFTGDTLSPNVETGLNLALTLTAATPGFNNLGIEAPFVVSGNTIAVIDPTGLTLQADVIADLSDTILGNIYRCRLNCCNSCGFWIQGIGSYRKREHDRNYVGYDNSQEGFLVGYNRSLCGGCVGLFGGATFSEAEVWGNTQKAEINSYLGGLTYETSFCDTFVGLAVAAGYLDWDNKRYVMNNLASGGVETALADIDGAFVSPELTLVRQFSSFWRQPIASFTLRYAGFFPDSYHERGSLADLSVSDREIDLLTTRFEIALLYGKKCDCWNLEPYIGVFGRYQVGGYRIEGELLGKSIRFDQGGPRNLAAFLLGFRGICSVGRFNLFLNIEGSFDTARSNRVLGEGGVGWNF